METAPQATYKQDFVYVFYTLEKQHAIYENFFKTSDKLLF